MGPKTPGSMFGKGNKAKSTKKSAKTTATKSAKAKAKGTKFGGGPKAGGGLGSKNPAGRKKK